MGEACAIVPIEVSALVLDQPMLVVETALDLAGLPFTNGDRDVNGGAPYVSAAISSRPFQDLTVRLDPGVHLHWSLPTALRMGEHDETGVSYPEIPNRWLVTASIGGQASRQWVVESDYLHPPDGRARPDHIAFPVPPDPERGHLQPFRHLGRVVPLEDWTPFDPAADRLHSLTAVGYGDPTFAAMYPNCRNVLGLHDPLMPEATTQYTVIGWYSDSGLDLMMHARGHVVRELGRAATADELAAHLSTNLDIQLERSSGDAVPRRSLLVGSAFAMPGPVKVPHVPTAPRVVLGPSGAESVARLLADKISAEHALTPEAIEEQIDLVLLGSAADRSHVDHVHRFAAACHASSFEAVSGGSRWRLVPTDEVDAVTASSAAAGGGAVPSATRRPPPDDVALALDELERLQRRLDDTLQRRHVAAVQLFADWQRWMICRHSTDDALPDSDRVMDLIRRRDLPYIDGLDELRRQLNADVAVARRTVEALLGPTDWRLTVGPDAPFHVQSEPYLLLHGDAVEVNDLELPSVGIVQADPDDVHGLLADVEEFVPLGRPSSTEYPPWRPVLIDWEVEVFAVQDPHDIAPGLDVSLVADYPSDHLLRHYHDDPDDVDLLLDPQAPTGPSADIVAGRALLTHGATRQASAAIDEAVWAELVRDDFWHPDPPPAESERRATLDVHADRILDVYRTRDAGGIVATALEARAALADTRAMGQVMSGFNAGLLTHRQMPQLPIDDPLGFREHRYLTAEVRDAVGLEGLLTPLGETAFHPIRALDLSLLQIRVVDRFGRHLTLDRDGENPMSVVPTRQLERNERHPARVHLPARIAHPVRVDASWLAAEDGLEESGDHLLRTPICGWLVPDHLDRGFLVHETSGVLAGRIATDQDPSHAQLARWNAAPGESGVERVDDLTNTHLVTAVQRLQELGHAALDDRLTRIDHALEMIEPNASGARADLALLMGQPLALVRARIDVKALGGLPLDQGWPALRRHLTVTEETARDDRGLGDVIIGVRLGAFNHLDDGLVAHWVEDDDGTVSPMHMAETTVVVDDDGSRRVIGSHAVTLPMTIDGPSVTVTMLIDPRAPVHITTGILPVQRLVVHTEHHAAAMQAMSFVTLAAPLLSPEGSMHVPLPHEPERRWTWLERRGVSWAEVGEAELEVAVPPSIDRRQVLHEGWLRLDHASPDGDVAPNTNQKARTT